MRYRLFVDESGTHSLGNFTDNNNRYLTLTGVALELNHALGQFTTDLESLKARHFTSETSSPIILHRKEMVNKTAPFECLRDQAKEQAFNADFLAFVATQPYTTFTVTIDKKEHLDRYQAWRYDPYHYCFEILLERYVRWLERKGCQGDVLCEARYKLLDKKLKRLYSHFHEHGTSFVPAQRFRDRLTTKELKFATKPENIAGLQFVDLLTHPCRALHICRKTNSPIAGNFGGQIAALLEASKHDRYG